MDNSIADEISLLKIIRQLCIKKIRQPMTMEQVKSWLNQFADGPERILGLLILRHLIFRTLSQLDSSFKQALKCAATHFMPENCPKESTDWRDVLNGRVAGLDFSYGPPTQGKSRPGKSGEIISRQLKFCDPLNKFKLSYPDKSCELKQHQRYLLIDDATFTGNQLSEFLLSDGQFLTKGSQCGIVVGLAHEEGIKYLSDNHSNIPVFYGEKITTHECFGEMCKNWIDDGVWSEKHIDPFNLYLEVTKKANFADNLPLGYGNLGCMIAYEHGIPDNSLQLLWDKSKKWNPLVPR